MPSKNKSWFTGPLILSVGLLVSFIAFGFWVFGAMGDRAEEQCSDLCTALGHKKIKMTDLGCVCENPKTQERNVHTGSFVEFAD